MQCVVPITKIQIRPLNASQPSLPDRMSPLPCNIVWKYQTLARLASLSSPLRCSVSAGRGASRFRGLGRGVDWDIDGLVLLLIWRISGQQLTVCGDDEIITTSAPLACRSIIPGPLTVRQKCCDGSLKKSSWKRTSPQN